MRLCLWGVGVVLIVSGEAARGRNMINDCTLTPS